MQIVGGGEAIVRGPEEERPHPTGASELWQESVVMFWWDLGNSVGGFHRIGHEPNYRDGPQISLCNHVFSRHHIYKHCATLPLADEDRIPDGFGGGKTCRFRFTDHAIWTITAAEVEGELHVHDCHAPLDVYPKKSGMSNDFSPNHMEVGSRISGRLRIKDVSYDVNGLAFRDHGWGDRDWSSVVSHRWVAMSFGDDMMALALTFQSPNDDLVNMGCIVRDGKLIYAREVDVLTYMEIDGLTHRGGSVDFTLTTGEKLSFQCTPLQKGAVSWYHGISCVDTMCEVRCGDLVGICDFEVTNNPLRGSHRPSLALNGIEKNGLHAVG